MTTYYIDPTAATNGAGTAASPFNTWTGVPVAAGAVYKQKRGTSWSGAFPSLTSGTSGNVTTIAAYANADGSDDVTLPKPIINIGDTMMPGTLNSPKTFTKWSMLDIRCARTTIASDTPIMWLGSDVEISDCALTSNLTALYGEKCSRVQILRNTITAATASTSTASVNAIVIAGSVAIDSNVIDGNTILVGDGGPAGAHTVKIAAGVPIASLQVTNNTIRTVSGQPTAHVDKAGIYVGWSAGAALFGPSGTAAASIVISGNDVANMVDGAFLYTVSNAWVHHNKFDNNGSFGLHVTGTLAAPSTGCLIEWNKCRYAGRNVSPWYGRGIELSGGGKLDACTQHVVRFNDCSYAKNWGGPSDNGTEGVGIGLDDATSGCLVHGNLIRSCEGNAIQFYGGSTAPADTGGNIVTGNFIVGCGLGSYKNRRTSPVAIKCAAINMSKTAGSRTAIAYNVIVGGTGAIRADDTCSAFDIFGNACQGQSEYAVAFTPRAVWRASTATYWDSAGVLQVAAADAMRNSYNPANLAAGASLLLEQAAANAIRNNKTQGAVVGTPGTLPTNWLVFLPSGIARQVVAVSVVNGIEYIDLRIFGTASASGQITIYPEVTGAVSASIGQVWAHSAFVALVGGSLAGISLGLGIDERDSSGNFLGSSSTAIAPSGAALGGQRPSHARTLSGQAVSSVVPFIASNVASGAVIDAILRIGLPQLERDRVSSPIKTSGAAVARAADFVQGVHDNVYAPGIPIQIGSATSDANGSPTPTLVATGSQGDITASPLLDANYVPQAGSPLLDMIFRRGVPFTPLALDLVAA